MTQVPVESTDLESCLSRAQQERLILTRKGKPVAIVLGLEGMDREQVELGASERLWDLIAKRRTQRTMNRAKLEKKANGAGH
jgi:antitoxin (DNA-binding transcriptional repressor) of toxin-antitoxin stability system